MTNSNYCILVFRYSYRCIERDFRFLDSIEFSLFNHHWQLNSQRFLHIHSSLLHSGPGAKCAVLFNYSINKYFHSDSY